jgi:replication factor C subunit 3/5
MSYQQLHRQQVLELNASDDRKLDVVREQIKNFASTRTIFSSQFKLVILDEADAMTQAAQMALRRVIEKFTTNTRFCLICNYVNRIIPALQSRCTRFRFQPLPEQVVRERLQEIAQLEGVTVLDAGIDGILHLSKGDMRKCLNIMQSASMFSATIDESAVYSTVGAPPPSVVSATVHVLLNQPLNEAVEHVRALMTTSGVAVQDLITELHGFVVRMRLPPKVMLYLLVSHTHTHTHTFNTTMFPAVFYASQSCCSEN